ncbi:uncharacterized protein LOC132193576 [Neocloeon triangulifer]|uniref:uncharacterized protein LOC132193576 n=1 Tax=Neocloeon triangulifer TaxID=2078957 RepID=UPI00286F5807|nr:uncharacterized protein LOC132193576 [Neocloeon triangulifer]
MEVQWIVKSLLPKILATTYSKTAQLVSHEIGTKKGGNAGDGGFASSTFQMKINVNIDSKDIEDYVIAKIFPQDPAMRALHNTELQFINETLWYSEIVPAYKSLELKYKLDLGHLWPKYFGSVETEFAAIALEDLAKENFKLALPAANLTFTHARLAMEKIAKMHALSYGLAAHDPKKYEEVTSAMQDNRFGGQGDGMDPNFLRSTAQRGLDPLRLQPEFANIVEALDKQLEDPISMHRRLLTRHDDSTDVICHGDFLRNNVLYKHQGEDVVDACLIDFATIRVASPGSDLALFIYMSIDPKALEGNGLENLLKVYYTTLEDILDSMDRVRDPWRGSFEDLLNDFGRCAPLAYSIAAFFLPLMMAPSGAFQMEDMMEMTPEEQEEQNKNLGGPEATERLVNMLIDFQKRGFHKCW